MTEMLVSVVIPTFRRSELLHNALVSVLEQTYASIEIIVVDDNADQSEKESVRKVIEAFNGRVRLVENYRGKGACGARNCGIESSRGELVAFLDDDDIWHPRKIEKQAAVFKDSDVIGVLCNYYDVDVLMGMSRECKISMLKYTKEMALMGECPTSTSLVMVKKEVLVKVGLFDEAMPSFQDFEMWLRCLDHGDMFCIQEPLVKFIQHSSDRVSVNINRRLSGLKILKEKWGPQMRMAGGWHAFEKNVRTELYIANGRANIGIEYVSAMSNFWKAVVISRASFKSLFWFFLGLCGKKLGQQAYFMTLKFRGVENLTHVTSGGGW